jgi:hypothetical protein
VLEMREFFFVQSVNTNWHPWCIHSTIKPALMTTSIKQARESVVRVSNFEDAMQFKFDIYVSLLHDRINTTGATSGTGPHYTFPGCLSFLYYQYSNKLLYSIQCQNDMLLPVDNLSFHCILYNLKIYNTTLLRDLTS